MFKSVHDISEKLSIFSHHIADKTEGPGVNEIRKLYFLLHW